MVPPPNGAGSFNDIGGYTFGYAKEGILVGKKDLESMLYEIGFGADTEMVGFALNKGQEVSLAPEPLWIYIFNSSASFGAATKLSVSKTNYLLVPCT